jgi:RNase H-like domain found in reverse transcriptase
VSTIDPFALVSVAKPLTECLRKGATLHGTKQRQHAFDKLKEVLTNSPVLAMPIDNGHYILDVDSCTLGGAAVLQQYQDSILKIIEFTSRTFNSAERQHCITRLEMASIVFGLH